MKVSIITVCYNSKLTIRETLESVKIQNYNNIEHIIIDGYSMDNTLSIVNEYPHISKVISERDTGIYDAINKGIKLATGDIVGILNSDDFFIDNSIIAKIVNEFYSAKTQILFADVDFTDSNDVSRTIRHYSSKFFRPWMFRLGFQPAHPTFYTYKENFEKYGFYRTDMKIAADFELLLRFIYKNKLPYYYFNKTLVKMRLGGVSTSGIKSIIKLNSEMILSCKYNGIYTNRILVYSKYLIKWWGFVFKR